jgi:phage terminase large subunit
MHAGLRKQIVSTGYVPRPFQEMLHARLRRFNVLVCHRRFGKTVFSVNEMLDRAFRCARLNPQYAYIAPTYGQAERIAWDMLKQAMKHIPGAEFNQQKLTCTIPRPHMGDRIKIFLLGAENPDSLRGMYLDGVILDEYAQADPRIWSEVIRPALSDRNGWAIFIGTPKGQNHFWEVLQTAKENKSGQWFWAILKASQTKVIPREEINEMRMTMTEDEAEQELECSFLAALTGAYFGKQMLQARNAGRIGKVPHDPNLQVDTFWDLGINDTTTVWFIQQHRQEIRAIDYYEMGGEGLPHYAKMLKGQIPEGEHRSQYSYRNHEWPHDGGSRDLSTGKERCVTFEELGYIVNVNPRHDVADTINAARSIIPKVYFDEERCKRGITALENYTKKYDHKNKIWLDSPLHNWASHGADGFRLMAMTITPGEDRMGERRNLPRQTESNYNVFKSR